MKNGILILSTVLITFGLTGFDFYNWKDSGMDQAESSSCKMIVGDRQIEGECAVVYTDFFYDMGTRFTPIKKSEVDHANSLTDFLTKEETERVGNIKYVHVIVIKNERQTNIRAYGTSEVFTDDQIQILRSAEYSTHFNVRVEFLEKNEETGELEDRFFSPHLTVVPEKQAVYLPGKEIFLDFLRKNNKDNTANLEEDKLRPAALSFTITKKGVVSNVKLYRTSGIPSMDEKMIQLVIDMPGEWTPAENIKGKKVEQEMVISFGMDGC